MRKQTKVFLTLLVVITAVAVNWLISAPVAKSKSKFVPGSLEAKARKAKGGDEEAIRDLTDQVFYDYGQMLPAEVQNEVKDRVVRAEIEYKKNGKGGVKEMHVADAVNFLAEKFNAPDFVKTDPLQVKVLRARVRLEAPSFIAPDPEEKKGLKKRLGEPMNPEVSPLEATYLMLAMFNQKALNDDFQQSPRDFAIKSRRKPTWEAERGSFSIVVNDPRNIEKCRAVFHAAADGMKHMRITDALSLSNDTLNKLGLKK
jgi:hypothetical protein